MNKSVRGFTRCADCGRQFYRTSMWQTSERADGTRGSLRLLCNLCHHQLHRQLEARARVSDRSRVHGGAA